MVINIKSRKQKGRKLQNLIASKISEILNIPWGRDESIKPRTMGESGVDVLLIGKAKKLFPFAIEAKNQEKWSVHEWIKQAKSNSDKNNNWLLICKRNREDSVTILDTDIFFKLYKELIDLRNKGVK